MKCCFTPLPKQLGFNNEIEKCIHIISKAQDHIEKKNGSMLI